MRQLFVAALVLVLGIIVPLILQERYLKNCPEWVWRTIEITSLIGFVLLVGLSDPVYSRIWGKNFSPVFAIIFAFLAGGSVLAFLCWSVVIPTRMGITSAKTSPRRDPLQEISDKLDGISKSDTAYRKMLLDAASSAKPSSTIVKNIADLPTPGPVVAGMPFDLQAATAALENKRIQSKAQKLQVFGPYSDKLDLIVTTFTSFLDALAKQNGDVLTSDYQGIDKTAFVDPAQPITLKMKANSSWSFDINMVFFMDSNQVSVQINDAGGGGAAGFVELQMWPVSDSFSARHCQNGRNIYIKQCKIEDCEPVIKECLNYFIAAKGERNHLNPASTLDK